jgi:hypothetical protein
MTSRNRIWVSVPPARPKKLSVKYSSIPARTFSRATTLTNVGLTDGTEIYGPLIDSETGPTASLSNNQTGTSSRGVGAQEDRFAAKAPAHRSCLPGSKLRWITQKLLGRLGSLFLARGPRGRRRKSPRIMTSAWAAAAGTVLKAKGRHCRSRGITRGAIYERAGRRIGCSG